MLQVIGLIIGGYAFTRMFTAGIRAYPNDDKLTATIIRLMSIVTALAILVGMAFLLLPELGTGIEGLLR